VSKILLVDLHAVFARHWFASADQEIGAAYEGTVSRIAGASEGYDHVAVCYDWPPYGRKGISADYKANRDRPDPSMVAQLARVKGRLTSDGYLLFGVQGYEADDMIATCVRRLCETTQHSIDILTQDKDLMSLVTGRVNVVLLSDSTRMTPQKVHEKMGVDPCHVSELLALCGDKSDNVTGCPGCGPKRAAELLTAHGCLNRVLELAVKGDPQNLLRPPALRQSLIDHHQDVAIAWDLVALQSDAPIDVEKIFEKREVQTLKNEISEADFAEDDHGDAWEEPEPEKPTSSKTEPAPPPSTEPATIESKIKAADAPTMTRNEKPEPIASTAIEKRRNEELAPTTGTFETGLEPRSIGQAFSLAKAIYESRLFGCDRPEGALMIIMTGRSLGMSALTAMRSFHFIKGRPSLSSQGMAALVLRSGLAEYFEPTECSDESATYVTKRKNGRQEHSATFTIEDARRAQLIVKGGQWDKYPGQMCKARACAFLARDIYPDLLAGVYDPDESESIS
jgi:5'-3' exonuclease